MAEFQEITTYTIECPNPICPDPSDVRRAGTDGDEQVYRCKSCDKEFTASGSAKHKQFTASQIGMALDKYYSGVSYQQIAEFMGRHLDVPKPSKRSVHDWVKSYTIMAKRFMDGEVGADGREESASGKPIKAKTGDAWVADELFVKVGGHQMYLWNVMDRKTRYVLAAHLSAKRDRAGAIKVMEKALAAAEGPPKTITTDGLVAYVEAIETVLPKSTKHIKGAGIRSEVNNNLSERLQGTLRSRTKTQRGLESIRTGQDYVDGYVLDYNHFKDHEALGGRTPAEAAGVTKQVPWGESWEGVARMGGEVAEPKNVKTEQVMKKPGPKPVPESLRSAAEQYVLAEQERKQVEDAKAKRRARKGPSVTPAPRRHKRQPIKGRGKQAMRSKW